jgi:hypothetical protein
MPHAYASQFRAMVVEQVRGGRTGSVAEVAASVDVPQSTVFRWVRQDRIDRGELAGVSTAENAEHAPHGNGSRNSRPSWRRSDVRRSCSPRTGWCAQSAVRHRGDVGS